MADKKDKQTKKFSLTLISFLMTIMLLMIIGLAAIIMNPSLVTEIQDKMATTKEEQYSKPFEIITNTAITENRSNYVQMTIILGTKDKRTLESLNASQPPIKEILVRYINTNPIDVWTDAEKTIQAKNDIITQLNEKLHINVESVYITDIMKQ